MTSTTNTTQQANNDHTITTIDQVSAGDRVAVQVWDENLLEIHHGYIISINHAARTLLVLLEGAGLNEFAEPAADSPSPYAFTRAIGRRPGATTFRICLLDN